MGPRSVSAGRRSRVAALAAIASLYETLDMVGRYFENFPLCLTLVYATCLTVTALTVLRCSPPSAVLPTRRAEAMLTATLLLTVVSFTSSVKAYTFSTPNCSLPQEELHNFVSAPNVRGTLDILWTCLATIIACTYTVLHLNIPEQRDGRDQGWRGDLKWFWKNLKPSLKWTLLTILAPEYYTMRAIDSRISAQQLLRQLRTLPKDLHPKEGWTLAYAFYIGMGGFRIPTSNTYETWPALVVLQPKHFVELLKERAGDFDVLSTGDTLPTDAQISDKSKSDLFAKSITILQFVYFCLNCFIRFGRHLPVTLLELGILGFAACSFVSYVALFRKPRAVNSMITLTMELAKPSAATKIIGKNGPLLKISNDEGGSSPEAEYISVALAVILGSIHIAGWDFAFPSQFDRWLWRGCAVASVVLPLPVLAVVIKDNTSRGKAPEDVWIVSRTISGSVFDYLFRAYVISRIILIVLMVRCLFYLPPEAFTTTWAANIPHVG